MKITVLLATHNGATTLRRTMDSLCALQRPQGEFDVVAVDNASEDDSRAILESYADRLPLTVLSEPRPGKNFAFNTALERLDGDLIAMTDDDVLFEPDWLVELEKAALAQPDVDIFGGRIEPEFPDGADPELLKHGPLHVLYAATDDTLSSGPTTPNNIFGPNMAVRMRIIMDGERFNVSVGPDGTSSYAMGSEAEFFARQAKNGRKFWFVKEAGLRHLVRANQLNRDWVWARGRRAGRGWYMLRETRGENSGATFMGAPRYAYRVLITAGLAALAAKLTGDAARYWAQRWRYETYLGFILMARASGK